MCRSSMHRQVALNSACPENMGLDPNPSAICWFFLMIELRLDIQWNDFWNNQFQWKSIKKILKMILPVVYKNIDSKIRNIFQLFPWKNYRIHIECRATYQLFYHNWYLVACHTILQCSFFEITIRYFWNGVTKHKASEYDIPK